MSVYDVFGDGITRIRNGQMARLFSVNLLYSKMVISFCEIMKAEGYISGFDKSENERVIKVHLKYTQEGTPVIREIKRVSKLGCRSYVGKSEIGMLYRGLGIYILSTSKGVMQSYRAKEMGIGGEVLCSVF